MKSVHIPIRVQGYVPPDGGSGGRRWRFRFPFRWGAGLLVLALLGAAIYAITQYRLIDFELDPVTAAVTVEGESRQILGFWPLRVGQTYTASATAEGYVPKTLEFEVDSLTLPVISIQLEPLPGSLQIRTRPPVDGEVWLNDAPAGTVNQIFEELEAGTYTVEVRAAGYEPAQAQVEVRGLGNREEIELEMVAVEIIVTPVATLELRSQPSPVDVLVDGVYQGQTPLTLTRDPGTTVTLNALSPGHQSLATTVSLGAGLQRQTLRLKVLKGSLEIRPNPANATVRINGQVELQRQLTLPQQAQQVEVSAPGYVTRTYVLTPHPDIPLRLDATLLSESAVTASKRQQYEQALGLTFASYRPNQSFAITTTRRSIPVRLTRPFAILDREVSNVLYRRFKGYHDSGEFSGRNLNGDAQPAVKVDWNDAALFANYLSEQAGVSPFYRVEGEQVVGFDASSLGYRLPSEAEWVWLTASESRFAWGDTMPPPNRFANFADASLSELIEGVPKNYSDGYVASAPVATFKPQTRGKLYDLSGNVAEWMHDVFGGGFQITGGDEWVDPLGEAQGKLHVVRGASWRNFSQKELSLNNRRYDREGQDDIGFRLAYYLEQK